MQGTFSLVCLDVEFPHPLNRRLLDLQRNLSLFSRCHRGFPEASSGVPVEVASPSEDITAEDVQHLPLLRKVRRSCGLGRSAQFMIRWLGSGANGWGSYSLGLKLHG